MSAYENSEEKIFKIAEGAVENYAAFVRWNLLAYRMFTDELFINSIK